MDCDEKKGDPKRPCTEHQPEPVCAAPGVVVCFIKTRCLTLANGACRDAVFCKPGDEEDGDEE